MSETQANALEHVRQSLNEINKSVKDISDMLDDLLYALDEVTRDMESRQKEQERLQRIIDMTTDVCLDCLGRGTASRQIPNTDGRVYYVCQICQGTGRVPKEK